MKFYTIDPALEEAIDRGCECRVRIEIDYEGDGTYEAVREEDILSADFTSRKESSGGTSARGEVILENSGGRYTREEERHGAGASVLVSFSAGSGYAYAPRFSFTVDDAGFQEIRGPGTGNRVRLVLLDLSYTLRKTDEARDWTSPVVYAYSVVCDKSTSERSLVHRAASRAGLATTDIDCSTIPFALPYVKLERNLWAELSDLARAFRAHLETGVEKPLIFAHSPYQAEPFIEDESSYTLDEGNLFSLKTASLFSLYRNTVRLKFNRSETLERQEIWRYRDSPELYNSNLTPYYPFRSLSPRAVGEAGYTAPYRVAESGGMYRDVVYADQVDSEEEATARLTYDGGPIAYSAYDTSTYRDRALVTLEVASSADLYTASIYGRPIVLDLNCSAYARDEDGIERFGTRALNVTSGYFSNDMATSGKPQYEDWAERELAERKRFRKQYAAKTHRALCHARVGARVTVRLKTSETEAVIKAMTLSYRKGKAFVASFHLEEL